MHEDCWEQDVFPERRDRFVVLCPPDGVLGQWLGEGGPEVDDEIVELLNSCEVYGTSELGRNTGTAANPVAYGGLHTGLHVEMPDPRRLVAMVCSRATVPAAATALARPRRGVAGCDEPADCRRKGPC